MDSLTQIVLGAAVGEGVAGRKIGNKAMVVGAVAGTIPDLDVVVRPLQDVVEYLSFHRSFTHSISFAILFSPLFAWLMGKFFPRWNVSFARWTWLYFLGFFTHALLDCFTTWGTQIFYPFTNYSVALYSVFVIDPSYTVPFLACLIVASLYHRTNMKRAIWNYAGIIWSTGYLMFTVWAQSQANQLFEEAWEEKGIDYDGYITKPTPFNAIFWSTTAKSDSGFHSGFHSLLADKAEKIHFRYLPQRKELLAPYLPHPKLERLLEITKGYYTVAPAKSGKGIYINDLRFGEFNGWQPQGGEFVFIYHVWKEDGELKFDQLEYRKAPSKEYALNFWEKIKGN